MITGAATTDRRNPQAPFLRISVLGPFDIQWSGMSLPFPQERLQGRGAAPALGILKALLTQPDRFALRDWLMEQFWPESARSKAEERLDDVASGLRTILRPPGSSAKILHFVYGSNGKGNGYRLEDYPLIWVDADAFEWYVQQAARSDRFGHDSLALWEQAYQLASRGEFLPEERYSDWAQPRRERIAGLYRQCVHRLVHLLRQTGVYEQALLRMRSYWQQHQTDEDALRPLLEMLGERECYQEAELYARQAQEALQRENQDLDDKTQDVIAFMRVKQIQREQTRFSLTPIAQQQSTLQRALSPIIETHLALFQPVEDAQTRNFGSNAVVSIPRFWNVPYQRNPFFTGREKLLEDLHETLGNYQNNFAVTPQALCGLGGIGKTQIALEYAYRYSQEYQAVFWVKANSRANLATSLLSLAGLLQLSEYTSQDLVMVTAKLQQWLREHQHWLLIFDNVDDLTSIRDLLPTIYRGHILLTTQAQVMGRIASRIEVAEMDTNVGIFFLLRRAGIINAQMHRDDILVTDYIYAQAIVHMLGGLPLALDQAGAYIEEAALSLQEYVCLYQQQHQNLLNKRGGLIADHPEPVTTTWSLAFTRLMHTDPVSTDLLRLCVFLDPDGIAEEILVDGAPQVITALSSLSHNMVKFYQAIELLRKFSFVRRNAHTKILTIHRLVQVCLQERMSQQEQRLWATRTIQAVAAVFPTDVTLHSWLRCQRLLPHVHKCLVLTEKYQLVLPEARTLFNQAGYYLRERAFYQQTLTFPEPLVGRIDPDTAQILSNLARLHSDTLSEMINTAFLPYNRFLDKLWER